jgi:hypothetical protein
LAASSAGHLPPGENVWHIGGPENGIQEGNNRWLSHFWGVYLSFLGVPDTVNTTANV